MSLSTHTAPQSGNMDAALQGEASMAANWFSINGTAKIEPGVKLELGHPLVGGKTALFVGGYFILRNYKFGAIHDSNGIMRRAIVERMPREGKKPLELLSQPNGQSNLPLYLLVNTHVAYAESARAKEQFMGGVDTDEEVIACQGDETLVKFSKHGSSADIHYSDGSVKRVVRAGPQLVVENLSLEEQAQSRIEMALWEIDESQRMNGDMAIRRRDRSYHQLISILAIGGKRSEDIFTQVFELLKEAGREGKLVPSVLQHATKVMEQFSRSQIMEFEDATMNSRFARHPEVPMEGPTGARRSTPAERKAFVAHRAAVRATQGPAKGPSGSKPQANTGKKQKGK